MSVRRAVITMYGLAGAFCVLGVALILLNFRWRYVLAVFIVMFGFIMVTAYKYGHRQVVMDSIARRKAERLALGLPAEEEENENHAMDPRTPEAPVSKSKNAESDPETPASTGSDAPSGGTSGGANLTAKPQ